MGICNLGLGNTGTPTCQPIAKVAKKLFVMYTNNSTGAKNQIDTSVAFDQAALDALINHADPTQRLYPLVNMENVTNVRGDSIFETSAGGTTALIKKGTKAFFSEMWSMSHTFLGQIEDFGCTQISAFVLTTSDQLVGNGSAAGFITPIKINAASWDAKIVETTDTTVQKVSLGFEWHQDEKDGDLCLMESDEYTADLAGSRGLLDITAEYSNITTAGFTVELSTLYGTCVTKIKDKGLLLANVVVNEISPTPGVVALASFTEQVANPGTYDAVFSVAQTSADVLAMTVTANGRDYTAVTATQILIP